MFPDSIANSSWELNNAMAKWPQMASVERELYRNIWQLRCRKTLRSSSQCSLQVFRICVLPCNRAPSETPLRVQHPTLKLEPLQSFSAGTRSGIRCSNSGAEEPVCCAVAACGHAQPRRRAA